MLLLGFVLVLAGCSSVRYRPASKTSSDQQHSSSRPVPPSTSGVGSAPPGSFNVVSYGANPHGEGDSTPAFRRAIQAAEARDGTVWVPPGTYLLDEPRHSSCQDTSAQLCIRAPITLMGAGTKYVTLVNEIGLRTPGVSHSMPMIVVLTGSGGSTGGADGTKISHLTLNSSRYEAGTDVMDFANDTVLQHLDVQAARSTNHYNPNSFGVRVIAVCNPYNYSRIYRSHNEIEDLEITGDGSTGNTELDISCQDGTSLNNVSINGNGMDIYISRNISVNGAVLTGKSSTGTPYTWVINDSSNVSLDHITTYGSGGVIVQHKGDFPTRDVTVEHETMEDPTNSLFIGDVVGLELDHDVLGNIAINPVVQARNINLVESTVRGEVTCHHRSLIEDLVGLSCP